ncbi:MAG: hypothetical protein CM15mP46_0290 [Alphaproteobacteria bacterium]|nr:MAG: hypothetical protein CM15mP46_0290 [Alphaproteobacteria bacterium]
MINNKQIKPALVIGKTVYLARNKEAVDLTL